MLEITICLELKNVFPEQYNRILTLAQDCGCETKLSKDSIFIRGPILSVILFQQELSALYAKIAFLERCLLK